MKFFDPKEEVLDIQLTPYGKFLYSKGLFDPKSYSFSDSEVLYNPACAGFEESQNSASFRITEETPYGKITSRNSQAEAGMADIGFSELKNKQSVLQDSINAKLNSLGSMTVGNQIGPKIKLFVLEGELSSSSPFYSSPDSAGLSDANKQMKTAIPQVDILLTYKSSIVDSKKPENVFNLDNSPYSIYKASDYTNGIPKFGSPVFEDGGEIVILPQDLLIFVEEENVNNSYDNFELEVFEIMQTIDSKTGNYELRKLRFFKSDDDFELKNSILIEEEEKQNITALLERAITEREELEHYSEKEEQQSVDSDFEERKMVDYYFSINSDYYGDLGQDKICSVIRMLKARGFKLDLPYDCPDLQNQEIIQTNIYASQIIDPQKC